MEVNCRQLQALVASSPDKNARSHWIRGLLCPRGSLDAFWRREKLLTHFGIQTPDCADGSVATPVVCERRKFKNSSIGTDSDMVLFISNRHKLLLKISLNAILPSPFGSSKFSFIGDFAIITIEVLFNPLNAELNPIRHFLSLVGARHIVHVSRIRVKSHPPFASIGRSSPYCPR